MEIVFKMHRCVDKYGSLCTILLPQWWLCLYTSVIFWTMIQAVESTTCLDHQLLIATDVVQYFVSHRDFGTSSYSNNALRCWKIVTENTSHVVELTADFFHLEVSAKGCSFDYVTVYDGNSEDQDSVLGQYCGEVKPDVHYSSQKTMYIKFQTDASVTETGFKFGYKSIHESLVPKPKRSLSTSVMLGIIFAALICLIIVSVVAVLYIKSKKNKVHNAHSRGIHSHHRGCHINTLSGSYSSRREHPVVFSPPPSYEDAVLHSNRAGQRRQSHFLVPGHLPIPSATLPRRSTLPNTYELRNEAAEEEASNATPSAYRRSMSYQLESVSYSREMNPMSPPPPYSPNVNN